jgi:hypothetical protein
VTSDSATAAQEASRPKRRRGRATVAWIVLVLAGLFLLLSSFAVWVNRVALNTEVFSDTSSQLLEDDAIRTAVATRAVDELFDSVDVNAELKAQLPADYKSLSGPAAAGLREASYTLVARALEQPRLQRVWQASIEESHETLVQILEGDGDRVSTEGGVVTLDLERIVLEAADRIGIREQVEGKLPEDVGRIEILRSDELDTAQNAFQLLKTLAWALPLLTLGAFALVVWLSGDRRRAVRRIGVTIGLVGVLVLVAVNLTGNYIVNELVAEADTREAASNAWDILTELLRDSSRWLVAVGILFLIAAWLAGPGPRAVGARRLLAPAVRDRVWAYGALAIVGLILLLTGPVGDFARLLVVVAFIALGAVWIEVTRTQTRHEFPAASGASVLADMRAQISSWWEEARERVPQQRPAAAAPAADLTSTLASLADLHTRGELTDEEFAAAKARVLSGS